MGKKSVDIMLPTAFVVSLMTATAMEILFRKKITVTSRMKSTTALIIERPSHVFLLSF